MLNQGLVLTFTGMATVFSFLILLVLIISLSSKIILRFVPEEIKPEPRVERKIPQIDIAVAIAAATARKEGKL